MIPRDKSFEFMSRATAISEDIHCRAPKAVREALVDLRAEVIECQEISPEDSKIVLRCINETIDNWDIFFGHQENNNGTL